MNIDRLVCVGVNHQRAPLDLRDRLSQWPNDDLRTEQIDELVILSTCNRLELYAYLSPTYALSPDPTQRFQPLIDLITTTQEISSTALDGHLIHFAGAAVTEHLCLVAAGLDSIVMGEGQILGQVNGALQRAYQDKTVGQALSLLFRTAIKAGRRARTETKISAHPVSISSAAVALAAERSGDLRTKQVAVVGLGEMGQLALKGLRGRGVTDLLLLNRTHTRAATLAATYGGQAMTLGQLPEALRTADIVITATSAVMPIIDSTMVRSALTGRANRPLILIDLAVPRNIDPQVASLAVDSACPLSLYDVDDMHAVVDDAFAAAGGDPQVHAIIGEMLVEWRAAAQALQLRPVVVGLRQQAEQMRQQAVARMMRYLERQQGSVDDTTAAQLSHLSRILVNQLLHQPTVKLKEKSQQADGATYAALICELFDLDVPIHTETAVSATASVEDDPTFAFNWLFSADGDALVTETADAFDFAVTFEPAGHYDHYELVGQP